MNSLRVLVVDDTSIYRMLVSNALRQIDGVEVVGSATNGEEALTEAWDRMDGKDPDAAELERQFELQEREDRVAAELELLKAEVGEGT